jgi:NAD(P)-dependent dehydrogenase (short-subunit alcohol dehydrogenase family)
LSFPSTIISLFQPLFLTPKQAKMSTDFKGKVIAITGAASGIAFATSKLLAERGAILAMADRNEKLLDTAVLELKSSGATVTGTGEFIHCGFSF